MNEKMYEWLKKARSPHHERIEELEEERKKRLQAIADRCSTCNCMYPCSDARADSARAMRPHEL